MGFQDAKYMGVIVLTILFVINAYALGVPEFPQGFYSTNVYQVWFGAGGQFNDTTGMINNPNNSSLTNIVNATQNSGIEQNAFLDFSFFSIKAAGNLILNIVNFMNAPTAILLFFIQLDGLVELLWVAGLVQAVWAFMLMVVIGQIITGRN